MTEEPFPDDVRQFVADYIHSVAELEVLLLLRGSGSRCWCADEVAASLYTSSEMAGTQLADLSARGLLRYQSDEVPPRYQYHPQNPGLEQLVSQLDEVYQQRRVSVITMIYSKPVDKVRTFADSFRLRKDK
jgi:hypothetical protein